jgi:hypothetical protein
VLIRIALQTFFGTNFVVYLEGNRTIQLAKDFWIFIAIAAPLTLLTLGIWFIAVRRKRNSKKPLAELDSV